MLNSASLKSQLQQSFESIFPKAFEQAFLVTLSHKTDNGSEYAEAFGKTASQLISEPLAEALSAAIDYYVKNISISGTIITTGSPVTQTAPIVPAPTPVTAGVVPNTLKVQ